MRYYHSAARPAPAASRRKGYEHKVNSHIDPLRNKILRDSGKPEIIETVRGVGYRFAEY